MKKQCSSPLRILLTVILMLVLFAPASPVMARREAAAKLTGIPDIRVAPTSLTYNTGTAGAVAGQSGQPVKGLPADAQSTMGPLPPAGIDRGETISAQAAVTLVDVPAYLWKDGCGPTAAGMLLGYWDGKGFDKLVSGDAGTQTAAVDAMIASTGHYNDYALPIDYSPILLPDKSEPPEGDEHANDSVADFMKTSQSYYSNYYGWSWFSDMDDALRGYVHLAAPEYSVNVRNQYWGTFTWESYKAEIDSGRPVVLLVDSNGDGNTDHFVTAMGYDDVGGNKYAIRDTWDTNIHWYDFAQIAGGQPWGIYGATLFQIQLPGLTIFNDGTADLVINNIDVVHDACWLSVTLPQSLPISIPAGGAAGLGVDVSSACISGGVYNDIIRITSNDPDENPVDVPVTLNSTPLAPSGLTASLQTGPKVLLSWTDNATNETGFEIQRKVNSGSCGLLTTVPTHDGTGTTTYTDATVIAGNTYSYMVRAMNANGNSAFTASANVAVNYRIQLPLIIRN